MSNSDYESYSYDSGTDTISTENSAITADSAPKSTILGRMRSFSTDKASKMAEIPSKMRFFGDETAENAQNGLENALIGVSETATKRIVKSAANALKNGLKNDFQPKLVHRLIDNAIDELTPRLEREIFEAKILPNVRKIDAERAKINRERGNYPNFCPNFPNFFRCVILYTLEPFDRNIWQKIRDPIWWLLTLILAFPRYGVSQIGFLVLFALTDLRDEYQLLQYILGLKAFAFIGQGFVPLCVGAARLFYCVYTAYDVNSAEIGEFSGKYPEKCVENGPQIEPFEMAFYALQIFLTLFCWILIPFSRKKEIGFRFPRPEEIDPRPKRVCGLNAYPKRGGRIHYFLIYDLIILLGIGGLCLAVYIRNWDDIGEKETDFVVYGTFYWAKILYGILALPWILFKLPLFNMFLTNAKATGYDKTGNTKIVVAPRIETEKELENDLEREKTGKMERFRSLF
eukprot:TRINITY_DN188_c1_g3_i2.p1 TRINITY_DN188_c1_g3~~TRINITY_DN188_c1_g3_i2.p1  ORF type:complete len:494 (-),score=103.21 TRINITY_DN188_c1_g3_i2:441-1814(-)